MVSLRGSFHLIWGDALPGSRVPVQPKYILIDHKGNWYELSIDQDLLRNLGGPRRLRAKQVAIRGNLVRSLGPSNARPRLVRVRSMRLEDHLRLEAPDRQAGRRILQSAQQPLVGSQPWVNILCRFGDATGITPHPPSYVTTLMGSSYPGLDHYWRELSYEIINISGTAVLGWYDLPEPRSYYVYDRDGDGEADLDWNRAANDCTAVADSDVFFPSFVGINLMFNQDLDCCAWGGGWELSLDGQTKVYSTTWLPPWGYENQGVLGHEMGHGFGLPHSSGPYSQTYDSRWDVMSNVWDNCSIPDPDYGCVGVHTISYHKDILEWVDTSAKYVASPGSDQTISLERLGQPISTSDYLMAQIPIGSSSSHFYTVEARQLAGYDAQLPGEGVIIHQVDTTLADREAQVVDPDLNGDPNDSGAIWTVGESFSDSANEITVSVDGVSGGTYTVCIALGGNPPPANDDFAGAMSVGSVPFSHTVDTRGATTEPTDPVPGCGNGSRANSVWYLFVPPANGTITADTFGSDYDTILSAFTGGPGAFLQQSCNDDYSGLQSQIEFNAAAGGAYFFMVTHYSSGGGTLVFNLNFAGVSISPPSVMFGAQLVGTSSSAQTVTVANTGGAPVTLFTIGVAGGNSGDFAQTNDCPSTLAAGTGCTIYVTFTPTAAGPRKSSVVVTDDTAGSPHTVILTGLATE